MSYDPPFGKYSYGAPTIHWGYAKLIVGNFCSIGTNVLIYLGGNHRKDWVTTYPFGHIHRDVFDHFNGAGHPTTNGDVVIGSDVWIADRVTIMSGVQIADGAIVANNSHVVRNVPPYAIVGGNPANIIAYRFSREQISQLLRIQWWNWDDEKINANLHLLCQPNIDLFLATHMAAEVQKEEN